MSSISALCDLHRAVVASLHVPGWGGNEPTMAEFAGVNFGTQCVE